MKGKTVRVILVGDAKAAYATLQDSAQHRKLFSSLLRKIDLLKTNPGCGIHIPRRLIPRAYVDAYGIENLWKINLPCGWRMLYTIKGTEVEILCIVLDVFDHGAYDALLGYDPS